MWTEAVDEGSGKREKRKEKREKRKEKREKSPPQKAAATKGRQRTQTAGIVIRGIS
jgi:hypothetical protein